MGTILAGGLPALAISCQLSAISFRLSAVSYRCFDGVSDGVTFHQDFLEGVIPSAALSPAGRGISRALRLCSVITERAGLARYHFSMRKPKRFYVYIMASVSRSHVLYTGVTGNLLRRVFEHKNKLVPGFTCRYNVTRLVYYESFAYPESAIDREKEIKGWNRSKKIRLIESMNPHWHDFAEHWWDVYERESSSAAREIPRAAGESAALGMTPS
jgi:putative endonuclease